ncbi:retrotransposon hot spot (RHS) protein [Trypanosoma conorhini]|uniref:Retrotransposon hot spot (RHS) protein n=1 Tax=Trypanosoma conorhini TaxID=83891 RepID=A0A422MV74_9TRYP|nr:retrotransposon hot spot (RHS) protein [Trypanosoma conorhini]RNE97145.1 retrotransposon hot spot (RHS) protein [Trypanosoma conorhini]
MPPKRTRARAAESSATDLPRGQRHARAEPDSGDSTAPPAQRRRVEEKPARQRWTLTSTVKDVLLEGVDVTEQMTLNDFISKYVGSRFVVDEGRGVKMWMFARMPARCVTDPELRDSVLSVPAYQLLKDAPNLHADARKLAEHGVDCLEHWKEFDQKGIVSNVSLGKLDSALKVVEKNEKARQKKQARARQEEEERKGREEARARRIAEIASRPIPEGLYRSVLNARWSHVLELPEGEGEKMEVKEGQRPAQSWVYNMQGITFQLDDDAEQIRAPRPRLMIVSSEAGWLYSLVMSQALTDCYVNREVDRVWRIVQGDLDGEFVTEEKQYFDLRRRLVLGTPGIGKSMNAGSYILYQLLRYRTKKLNVVVYCFGGDLAYVFDKTKKSVTVCSGAGNVTDLVYDLAWRRKMKGYIIYDVDEKGHGPSRAFPPSTSWGIIVLSSPSERNFKGWAKQMMADLIVMNCPDKYDAKAMCAWETRNQSAQEQVKRWKLVEKRMDYVGPIPRFIFDRTKYVGRLTAADGALDLITASTAENYIFIRGMAMWPADDASHKLVMAARIRGRDDDETFVNLPICSYLGKKLMGKLTAIGKQRDFLYQVLRTRRSLLSEVLEKYGVYAFTDRGFVDNVLKQLKPLKPPEGRETRPCVLQSHPAKHPDSSVELAPLRDIDGKIGVEYGVLYVPLDMGFPMIDGFFFVDSPRKTMVGLQTTLAKQHHTTVSKVKLFNEQMTEYFINWGTFSKKLYWDIIYVQHGDSEAINTWQKCNADAQNEPKTRTRKAGKKNNEEEKRKVKEEKRIKEFWDKEVRQYQVAVSDESLRPKNNAQRRRQSARQVNNDTTTQRRRKPARQRKNTKKAQIQQRAAAKRTPNKK